jgi:hypothetical protein
MASFVILRFYYQDQQYFAPNLLNAIQYMYVYCTVGWKNTGELDSESLKKVILKVLSNEN